MIFELAASSSLGKGLLRSMDFKLHCIFSAEIANFFEPAIQNIIKAIEEQSRKSTKAIKVRSTGLFRPLTDSPTYRLSFWSEDLLLPIICVQSWRIILRRRISIS